MDQCSVLLPGYSHSPRLAPLLTPASGTAQTVGIVDFGFEPSDEMLVGASNAKSVPMFEWRPGGPPAGLQPQTQYKVSLLVKGTFSFRASWPIR
jgi:hypothetical protein